MMTKLSKERGAMAPLFFCIFVTPLIYEHGSTT